jgi:hypothetical protein
MLPTIHGIHASAVFTSSRRLDGLDQSRDIFRLIATGAHYFASSCGFANPPFLSPMGVFLYRVWLLYCRPNWFWPAHRLHGLCVFGPAACMVATSVLVSAPILSPQLLTTLFAANSFHLPMGGLQVIAIRSDVFILS